MAIPGSRFPITDQDAHAVRWNGEETAAPDEPRSTAEDWLFPGRYQDRLEAALRVRLPDRTALTTDLRNTLAEAAHIMAGVSVRTRTELALKDSLALKQAILDATPHAVAVTRFEDGTLFEINQGFSQRTGYHRDEVLGRPFENLGAYCDPKDRERIRDELMARGAVNDFEIPFRMKNGMVRNLLISCRTTILSRQKCVVTVGTDITGLKEARTALQEANQALEARVRERTRELEQANQALRASEERLRAVYKGLPVPTYVLKRQDDEFILLGFNDAADRVTNGRLKEYLGIPTSHSLRDRADVLADIRRCHDQQTTIIRELHYTYIITGRTRNLIASFAFVPPDMVLISSIDITDRVAAEKKLLDHQDQLRRMASELTMTEARERRRIATDLHDQIGQILFLVHLKLKDLARQDEVGRAPELHSIADMVGQTLRDVRTLIVDLSPPVLRELGLVEAIRELGDQVLQDHGLLVRVHEEGPPRHLPLDRSELLYRSIRELIFNTIKHAQARSVDIHFRQKRKHVRVDVIDDGQGFKASRVLRPSSEASGFGLFSIKERLTPLGGRFRIESTPGQGTRVMLTLPLTDSSPPSPTSKDDKTF
jgi:PAS domain S-box-containing protein